MGARIAVDRAVSHLSRLISTDRPASEEAWLSALQATLGASREALESAIETEEPITDGSNEDSLGDTPPRPRVLRDLATTLIAVALTDDCLAWAHIGDGAIAAFDHEDNLLASGWPVNGSYLDETVFLTSDNYEQLAVHRVLRDSHIRSLVMLTDGLELIALDFRARSPFVPFFRSMIDFARRDDASEQALVDFLSSPQVNAKTDDDKTLLLAVRA
jgi:hypothetical protein